MSGYLSFFEDACDDFKPYMEEDTKIEYLKPLFLGNCALDLHRIRQAKTRLMLKSFLQVAIVSVATSFFGTVVKFSWDTSMNWLGWLTYFSLMLIAFGFAYEATRNFSNAYLQKKYDSAYYFALAGNITLRDSLCPPPYALASLSAMLEQISALNCFVCWEYRNGLLDGIRYLRGRSFDCEFSSIAKRYQKVLSNIDGGCSIPHACFSSLISLLSACASIALNWEALGPKQVNFILASSIALPIFIFLIFSVIKSNYEFNIEQLWSLYAVYSYRYLPLPPLSKNRKKRITIEQLPSSISRNSHLNTIVYDLLRKNDSSIHYRCFELDLENRALEINRYPWDVPDSSLDSVVSFFSPNETKTENSKEGSTNPLVP